MAKTAKAKVEIASDPLGGALKRMLVSWEEKGRNPIRGALVVDGHPYWWVLEYGAGGRFNSLMIPMPIGIKLVKPSGALRRLAPTAAAYTGPTGQEYPIVAGALIGGSDKKKLVYWSNRLGRIVSRPRTLHPGVTPRGTVRRAILHFEESLRAALHELKADHDFPPEREEFVEVMNEHLEKLQDEIIRNTPSGGFKREGTHLQKAWRVIPAE